MVLESFLYMAGHCTDWDDGQTFIGIAWIIPPILKIAARVFSFFGETQDGIYSRL